MLTGNEIIKRVMTGEIRISPFNIDNIGPNSYDLRISDKLKFHNKNNSLPIDIKSPCDMDEVIIPDNGLILNPGTLYLGNTVEFVGSNNFIPILHGRSSIARLGMFTHFCAGFGDLGWYGQWTLEISVIHPLRIYPNIKVCQVSFQNIIGRPKLYDGKYQNQNGPTQSKMWMDIGLLQSSEYKGRYCSVCGDQQYKTSSSWTCQNGHDGASEIENIPINTKRICICGARFVAASDEIGRCWKCNSNKNFEVIDEKSKY